MVRMASADTPMTTAIRMPVVAERPTTASEVTGVGIELEEQMVIVDTSVLVVVVSMEPVFKK